MDKPYSIPTPANNDPHSGMLPDFYRPTPRGGDTLYVDFDLNLEVHPMTGDFALVRNGQAVMQSIRNLVMTSLGEIVMNGDIGGGLPDSLFETIDPLTTYNLSRRIEEVIGNFEPRAEIISIDVFRAPDNLYALIISIKFYIRGSTQEYDEQIVLERTR